MDEPEPFGPEMPLVAEAKLLSCCGETLTGAASGPHWSVVGPSCKSQGMTPAADSREPVTLRVSSDIFRLHVSNASFIHVSLGDKSSGDKLPEPLGGEGVDFIIVGQRFSA